MKCFREATSLEEETQMLQTPFDLTFFFITIFLAGFFIFILAGAAVFGLALYKGKGREEKSIDSVLLQVAVPKNNEVKIDAMEQLFSALYSIKKGGWKQKYSTQPTISFEIVARQEDIRFFIWTPKVFQDLIEKQIHGAYSDAEILEVPEYNIFPENAKVAYKSIQIKKDGFYPLKVFRELPTDPLASLTSALAKMGADEAAAIQVLISPADSSWQKAGASFITQTKKQESDPEKAKFAVSTKTLEGIENKISKPGFEASIRIVCVSQNEASANAHITNIMSAFEQFSGDSNGFGSRKIWRKGAFIEDFLYRYQPLFNYGGNRVSILNSEELATIYHFPNKLIATPHIYWIYSKKAPAPAQIPQEGLYLGLSAYRGIKRPVFIGNEDRLRHIYIIGKTISRRQPLLI